MKPHRTVAARAFGRALFKARRAAGMTQERLAELGDFDRTYPSLLERGLRTPTFVVIVDLAEALKTDAVSLFSDAISELRSLESSSVGPEQNQRLKAPEICNRPSDLSRGPSEPSGKQIRSEAS